MIRVKKDNIEYWAVGRYLNADNREVCHKIKEGDERALDYAAKEMAKLIHVNAVLVPVPSHNGEATKTLRLAQKISALTNCPVANVLLGEQRESLYILKHLGKDISSIKIQYSLKSSYPTNRIPVVIDNVVDTGATSSSAIMALGCGIVLTYAITNNFINK